MVNVKRFIDILSKLSSPNNSASRENIEALLNRLGFQNEIQDGIVDKILKYNTFENLDCHPYHKVLKSDDEKYILKICSEQKFQNELKIYNLFDLPETKKFTPTLIESLKLDKGGLMILSNVEKMQFASSSFIDEISHNLFLMGLFHKEATRNYSEKKHLNSNLIIPSFDYSNRLGASYCYELANPFVVLDNKTMKLFNREKISKELLKEYGKIFNDSLDYIKSNADTVIHGDWKPENTMNGYIFDFGSLRFGKEIEDISYYLTNIRFKLSPAEMKNYLNKYISIRSIHDSEFAHTPDKHKDMIANFDNVRFLQACLLGTIRGPEYIEKSRFYKKQLKEIYKNKINHK